MLEFKRYKRNGRGLFEKVEQVGNIFKKVDQLVEKYGKPTAIRIEDIIKRYNK